MRPGLSGTQLKYFACLIMFIDHLAHVWNPFLIRAGNTIPLPLWADSMYFVGRLAFPIFVFFVAESCRKTHDMGRYLLRLGVFTAVAQLPYSLLFETTSGSVMLTFLLGVLGVYGYRQLRGRVPVPMACLPSLALAWAAWRLDSDYGWIGVLLVLALYLCGDERRRQLLCLAVGLVVLYLVVTPLQYLSIYWLFPGEPLAVPLPALLRDYVRLHGLWHLATAGFALAALVPLHLYRGSLGKGNKWFFYWFYPCHLLALFALQFVAF